MNDNNHNILNVLDESIIELSKEEDKDHGLKKSHYPSDYGKIINGNYEGGCLREQVYSWWNIKPSDIEAKRKYGPKVGNLLEDFISNLLARKLTVQRNVEFIVNPPNLKYPIHGKIDAIVTWPDKFKTMLEIKTVHSRALSSKEFGMKHTGPKMTYILQLSFYKDHYEPCDEYKLLVFSREDFNRMEFVMGRDFEPINTKDYTCFETVEKYLEMKKLPPRTFRDGIDKFPCSWCEYRTRCYEFDKSI